MSRVEALRAVIRVAYLQRDFAAADGACSSLDLFEQTTADTTPSVTRQHRQVVDVHERLPGEGREADEAVRGAHRPRAVEGEQRERGGVLAQPLRKARARLGRERRVLSARAPRVGVDDLHQRLGVGLTQISLANQSHTSSSVSGRGWRPSTSRKPYSSASCAATATRPLQRMTLRSSASAATARPASSGLSEFDRSKTPAASTASVRTRPGYRDTTATQCGSKSCAHSAVSRSVAALATP